MKGKKYFTKFERFIHNISFGDRLAVLYHTDADGLCSALVTCKAIEALRGKKPDLVMNQGAGDIAVTKKTISVLKEKKIDKAIFVDLCIDQDPWPVLDLEKFASVLIIDHHKLYNDINSKKTTFIKAQHISDLDGSLYPASKLCFDLFSKLTDLKPYSWIACVGVIGDNGLKQWRPLIEKCAKRHRISLSDLEKLKELIGAVESVDAAKLDSLFKEFYSTKHPKKLLKSGFAIQVKKIEKELTRLLKKFEKEKEISPKLELVYFAFKSKYRIKSALINKVSNEIYPDKTVVMAMDSGKKGIQISARRQDFKVKVNDLLEKSIKGLKNATAGGHAPAAAAKIMKKDLKKFRKQLVKELGKAYA